MLAVNLWNIFSSVEYDTTMFKPSTVARDESHVLMDMFKEGLQCLQ